MTKFDGKCCRWATMLTALAPLATHAQVSVNDMLTGASSNYSWSASGGACLTAGDGRASTIPACVGNPYYNGKTQVGGVTGRIAPTPDPIGQGALRLTNGDTTLNGTNANGSKGSVVSTLPFPTNEGVKISFTTATYGGNGFTNGTPGQTGGADGIVFFMRDSARPPSTGFSGGSLGYTCNNLDRPEPPAGIDGGFLAIAADEYGNFSNPFEDTSTGPGYRPGHLVVRGSGSITYPALNLAKPQWYRSSADDASQRLAVRLACATGFYHNFSGGPIVYKGNVIPDQQSIGEPVSNYPILTDPVPLPLPMSNQQAVQAPLRSKATLITYDISISKKNVLNVAYAVNDGDLTPIIKDQSIDKKDGLPDGVLPTPLPASLLFGFSSSTGAGSNVHEITCFKATQMTTAASSAGSNVQQSSRIQVGSQIYLSLYHPENDWGQLTATSLLADAAGAVTISPRANWDAHCVLTGGACSATGGSQARQAPAERSILSWNGNQGIAFRYGSLPLATQTALGGATDGAARVDFLRGERKDETVDGNGLFRRRDGVLGDIINSSPASVGAPSLPYGADGRDALNNQPATEFGSSYKSFMSTYASRVNVVYAGANDGMLHGFRAGTSDGSNTPKKPEKSNDGREVLAFMPALVAQNIHSATVDALDFSSPYYAHNAYVDATPGTGDLYYNGAWHTWLVGGLGAGGNATGVVSDATSTATGALYALDITDPDGFSEANAKNLVIGEWNSTNLTCVNDALCKDNLGSVYGTPIIRRLHDGNWAVIFGNGRNSANGRAGLFIMTVNKANGARSFRFLDTGVGAADPKNGIDHVTSADFDGDHITDYLYAGDTAGNLWRFDLTSATPGDWNNGITRVFKTPNGQPIATRVTVNASLSPVGPERIILAFGTGRKTPQTLTGSIGTATGTQSLYGIWDWNLTKWNTASKTSRYLALGAAPAPLDASMLRAQVISTTDGAPEFRSVTTNNICWKGATFCGADPAANTQYGWKVDLPGKNEQVVYNPVMAYGAFIVNTTIPTVRSALTCSSDLPTGYTMAVSLDTGGALPTSLFTTVATAAGASAVSKVAGVRMDGTGTVTFVSTPPSGNKSARTFLISQTVKGSATSKEIDPANGVGKRLTWIKLR